MNDLGQIRHKCLLGLQELNSQAGERPVNFEIGFVANLFAQFAIPAQQVVCQKALLEIQALAQSFLIGRLPELRLQIARGIS